MEQANDDPIFGTGLFRPLVAEFHRNGCPEPAFPSFNGGLAMARYFFNVDGPTPSLDDEGLIWLILPQ
jgi:hypothetical protein